MENRDLICFFEYSSAARSDNDLALFFRRGMVDRLSAHGLSDQFSFFSARVVKGIPDEQCPFCFLDVGGI